MLRLFSRIDISERHVSLDHKALITAQKLLFWDCRALNPDKNAIASFCRAVIDSVLRLSSGALPEYGKGPSNITLATADIHHLTRKHCNDSATSYGSAFPDSCWRQHQEFYCKSAKLAELTIVLCSENLAGSQFCPYR